MRHTWEQTFLPPTADADVTLDAQGEGMHGQTALNVSYRSGSGFVYDLHLSVCL